ncbi:zinc finger protein 436-like isoform X1 [Branchiostoma floridae]|uniref:Zinc finger protein 436-like isoform X1 n=1 Tax=Branchiostoma floridae TaxID=7739 RepID=A0A9J7NCH7_BRAFL|nr:zinc finger protein 436-like isoform X1 [Branchiostoma floridae]XP_035699456.1 zinc finger protein 436-like isoform X1 [Branchiostoma floridae]
MSRQQFICGLSHEVTIAVLPRLNMEELMFELNRRIQNLDKENSIKDRLVSILRGVMLEEYRQLEKKSEVSSPDETTIPVQNQDNVLTMYAETMLSETSSSDASQQRLGLGIVIKKERHSSIEMLMNAEQKYLGLDSDQVQLIVLERDELSNTPMLGSSTISSCEASLPQMYSTDGCPIKEEDVAMATTDEAARACHDELNKKERNTSSDVLMYTREPEFDTDQVQLTVPQQDQLCTMPSQCSPTLPPCDATPIHMNNTTDFRIKEEDFDMLPGDEARRTHHDELNIDTSTFSIQVQDTRNSMNTPYSETPAESNTPGEEAPSASCHLPSDHGDAHLNIECHVSHDGQIGQTSQPSNPIQTEHYTGDRDFGFINNGHKQSGKYTSSEQTPQPSSQPTAGKDCENMASLLPANGSQIESKRHECDAYGFKTSLAHSFSQHRQSHKGEKPFMCDECGYRARRKYQLVGHMRRHTGEKPFKCNRCSYKASLKSLLVEHMIRHTKAELPYSCEICDYKTYRKSNLTRHLKCHAGVKPHKCEECGYSTVEKGNLIKHRRCHTGERPYSCHKCDYKAKDKGKLSRHIRCKHPSDCHKSKPAEITSF